MTITEEQWAKLHDLAVEASTHAYVPYSGYPVGAAALTADGRWLSGCNVENAGYAMALCAECGVISDLHRTGGGKLVAFTCVNGNAETIVPCGRCRQLLAENADEAMVLLMPAGVQSIQEVLPYAFGPRDLTLVPTSTYQEV